MAPADDDKPGGPFQGLPRPAAVRGRAVAANLPPATRSRDAPVEETWDDDETPAEPWTPQRRRDPARAAEPSGPTPTATSPSGRLSVPTPSPPTRASPSPNDEVSAGTPSGPTNELSLPTAAASVPSPLFRAGLLTPRQRYEGRLATGLGFEGLAAALGLGPNHGQRSIRRWEQETPETDPDARPTPRYVELLAKHAAGVPEVAEYLREYQGRGAPTRDLPPRSIEMLLLLAAEIPKVAAYLNEQGRGASDVYFRNRRRGR